MPASPERIREVIDRYIALVGTGTADEVVALYAEDATVEDPVGTEVRTGHAAIREFYAGLEGMEQQTRLITARIGPGEAAFHFEIVTVAGDKTYTLSPIDVMTFDDSGKVTSMRAFWSESDMVVS